MDFDAIVVGGGIAGLTASAYLAKAGFATLLCEKENACGGLVNSFERDGFIYDGGIRAMENSGVLFPMLKHLPLREGFTVALVNIRPLKEKDIVELKRAINKMKKTADAIEGEIAGFGEDYLVATPSFATIYRSKQTKEVREESEE